MCSCVTLYRCRYVVDQGGTHSKIYLCEKSSSQPRNHQVRRRSHQDVMGSSDNKRGELRVSPGDHTTKTRQLQVRSDRTHLASMPCIRFSTMIPDRQATSKCMPTLDRFSVVEYRSEASPKDLPYSLSKLQQSAKNTTYTFTCNSNARV